MSLGCGVGFRQLRTCRAHVRGSYVRQKRSLDRLDQKYCAPGYSGNPFFPKVLNKQLCVDCPPRRYTPILERRGGLEHARRRVVRLGRPREK